MAFVAPALAAIGGGSAIAGGITLATTAAGIYSSMQQIRAGNEAAADAKIAAKREADAARGEEIQRRRALQETLADRVAIAGASGAGTGGSIGLLARTDIRDNRNDLLTTSINSKAKQRALRTQGSNAKKTGVANAAASLLDTAGGLYDKMPRKAS